MSPATAEPHSPAPSPGKRVLVAEDSSITQDLLKLVLSQHGHHVDLAKDGDEALRALNAHDYDVALLDFHLPKKDGVQIASNFRAQNKGRQRPVFVAITADVEGLLAHEENCECFDEIVPKPVNINTISQVIARATAEEAAADHPEPNRSAPDTAPRAIADSPAAQGDTSEEASSSFLPTGYKLLRCPQDLNTRHRSARALQASLDKGGYDAVLVTAPVTPQDLAALWQTKALHLLPVIDLTGTLGEAADVDASRQSASDREASQDVIEGFHDRRAAMHSDLIYTDDLGEKLIGRLHVKGEPLTPTYAPAEKLLFRFNTVLPGEAIVQETRKLADMGLLSKRFVDRVHTCHGCNSAQFNVREDCPECRSANLREEPYLHHFRCAYQGPESDFRQGDDLVCPKCRKELRHFGRDYDKPGTLVVCQECHHSTAEPGIGFICLNCATRTDGDTIDTLDIHAFDLTDRGVGFVEAGSSFLGFTEHTLRFAELPLDLVIGLNSAAKRYNEDSTPFTLLDIDYQEKREIEREHGPRQFAQLRHQFLENLRAVLQSETEVPGDIKIVKGQTYDFALLVDADPETIRPLAEDLQREAETQLRHTLGAHIRAFGPGDLN